MCFGMPGKCLGRGLNHHRGQAAGTSMPVTTLPQSPCRPPAASARGREPAGGPPHTRAPPLPSPAQPCSPACEPRTCAPDRCGPQRAGAQLAGPASARERPPIGCQHCLLCQGLGAAVGVHMAIQWVVRHGLVAVDDLLATWRSIARTQGCGTGDGEHEGGGGGQAAGQGGGGKRKLPASRNTNSSVLGPTLRGGSSGSASGSAHRTAHCMCWCRPGEARCWRCMLQSRYACPARAQHARWCRSCCPSSRMGCGC